VRYILDIDDYHSKLSVDKSDGSFQLEISDRDNNEYVFYLTSQEIDDMLFLLNEAKREKEVVGL